MDDLTYIKLRDAAIKEHAEPLYTFSTLHIGIMLKQAYDAGYAAAKKELS